MCLPCPKSVCVGGVGGRLNALLKQGFALFVLVMTIILRCLQDTKTSCLPCFCCYFHFGGKQKADCKCLDWSPPISCLRKCKQEASCKCLTWSPFISYLKGTPVFSVLVPSLISFYDNSSSKPWSGRGSSFPSVLPGSA